ncbi:hypothetical protein TWF506_002655 [Arthrobotrys conoides]|uniref:Uncharacterized protein n=1 Tax=Arthrobotrys conoides TaxID=74498 RepID=A0AAN8RMC6_9PEZI
MIQVYLYILCLLNTVLAGVGPWPSDPNTVSDCYSWVRARDEQDCIDLARKALTSVHNFVIWNPRYFDIRVTITIPTSIYRDCDNVISGNGYCMGSDVTTVPSIAFGVVLTTSTTSSISSNTASTTSQPTTSSISSSSTIQTTTTSSRVLTAATATTAGGEVSATTITTATIFTAESTPGAEARPTPLSGTASNCITFGYLPISGLLVLVSLLSEV